jgi:hypothetical protein
LVATGRTFSVVKLPFSYFWNFGGGGGVRYYGAPFTTTLVGTVKEIKKKYTRSKELDRLHSHAGVELTNSLTGDFIAL